MHKNIEKARDKAASANTETINELATRATEMAHAATVKAKEAATAASPHVRTAAASAAEILSDAAHKSADILADTAEKLVHASEKAEEVSIKTAPNKKRLGKTRKTLKAAVVLGGIGAGVAAWFKSPARDKLRAKMHGHEKVDSQESDSADSFTLETSPDGTKAKASKAAAKPRKTTRAKPH